MVSASWLQRYHFVCPPVAIGLEYNLACWFWSEELSVHLWQAICFVCSQWRGEWNGCTWPSSTVSQLITSVCFMITSVCFMFTFTYLWATASISRMLCPSVCFRESIQLPFQLCVLTFVFPISFEIMAGSFALCSPGFTPLCCYSNLQFGMGFPAVVYYRSPSVDAHFIRVFCMCAAFHPPVCTFLYT